MMWLSRRKALLGGATLASLPPFRKPQAQTVLMPAMSSAAHLSGLDGLIASAKPVPAPAPVVQDGGGAETSIAAFLGKGVVLNLWATWCGPCVLEMPSLDALSVRLAGDGIVVLALSSDRGGAKTVARFYESHGITHLGLWLDPFGRAGQAYGARGLPTTLILDRVGREVARLEGGADWSTDAAAARVRALVG